MLQKQKSTWRGIRRHGAGWQVEIRVKGFDRVVKAFPLDTDPAEMQAWRKREKAKLQAQRPRASAGTFAADAKKYLALVKTMPSYKSRARDIALWVEVFGTRSRASITAVEIRAQRDEWLLNGPRRVWRKHRDRYGGAWVDVPGLLAASTVNHRLRALANLWTVLDGRHEPNPVRDVPEVDEPDGAERGLPYELIEMILAAMPDRGPGIKGQRRAVDSKTKARARVIAYVGLEHSAIGRLTPAAINLEDGWVDPGKRRKGKGALASRIPLTEHGVEALREFIRVDAFGPFSASSMRACIRRAARRVAAAVESQPGGAAIAAVLRQLRPYDFRHSYVSEMLEKSGDFNVARLLARHADIRTTLRYGKRAVNPVLVAALAKVKAAGGFAAPANRATTVNDSPGTSSE